MANEDSLMEWTRGGEIGCGSFSLINLAILNKTNRPHLPPLMAVKSAALSDSATLRHEIQVLTQLSGCPNVIRCYGDQVRVENGAQTYNLFLEYAAGGSLANEIATRGGRLPECDVRRHTRSVLEGLAGIHSRGFVHCDIKVQNILVFHGGFHGGASVKIADFGLARKSGDAQISGEGRFEWRGTPLYMSPESVNDNSYEAPCDVWALGCAVAEMATGKAAWSHAPPRNVYALMMKIAEGDEIPEIPENLSGEGRDFLSKCFVKDPRKRWTAEMLLSHPFVTAGDELPEKVRFETSPRCHWDFSSCDSPAMTTPVTSLQQEQSKFGFGQGDDDVFDSDCYCDAQARIQSLATVTVIPNWAEDSDCWIQVR